VEVDELALEGVSTYKDRGYTLGSDPYKKLKKPSGSYDAKTGTYTSSTGQGFSVSPENVSKIEQTNRVVVVPSRTTTTSKSTGKSSGSSKSKSAEQTKTITQSQVLSQNLAERTGTSISPGQPVYLNIDQMGKEAPVYTKTQNDFTQTSLVIDSTNLSEQAKTKDTAQRQEIAEVTKYNLKTREVNPFAEASKRSMEEGKGVSFREAPFLADDKFFGGLISRTSETFVERPVFGAVEGAYKLTGNILLPKEQIKSKPGSYLGELETIRTEPWSTTIRRGEIQEAAVAIPLIALTGGTGNIARGGRTVLGGALIAGGTYSIATAETPGDIGFGIGSIGLGALAIPKEFYPVKYSKTSIEGIGKVETLGFDVGTRGYPVISRLKTSKISEIRFGRSEFVNKINPSEFTSVVSFPETAVGGKAYLGAIDLPKEVKTIGVPEAIIAGRELGGFQGLPVKEYVTSVEGLKNPVKVSRAIESSTYDQIFGIKTRTVGTLYGSDPTRLMLPEGYGVKRAGDIDVIFPRKTTEQIGLKLGRLTNKLNVIEGEGTFAFKPEEGAIFRGQKKFLEAKSGINQDVLGLGDVAPSRVGGLRMYDRTVRFGSSRGLFGRGRAISLGQQFVRKLSGSLITSPGGKGTGETKSFSLPGILGKNVRDNPRGSKDVADFFATGKGLAEIYKVSPKRKVSRRALRGEKALNKAFENLYTPEQQRDILVKIKERTGTSFDEKLPLTTKSKGLFDVKIESKSLLTGSSLGVSSSVFSGVSRTSRSRGSKSPYSPSSVSSSISKSLGSKSPYSPKSVSSTSFSPKSPSPYSPRSFSGFSPGSRSPYSPRSPSPYSPSSYTPRSPPFSPSVGSPSDGGGSSGDFVFGKSKKTKFKEQKLFILPDLGSVSRTELSLGAGSRYKLPKPTSQVQGLKLAAIQGRSTGFIPTEQIRTGKVKL
jgi:hypothetical protein